MLRSRFVTQTLSIAISVLAGACASPTTIDVPKHERRVEQPVPDKLEQRLYKALTRTPPEHEGLECYDIHSSGTEHEALYTVHIHPICFSGDYDLPPYDLQFLVTPPHTYLRLIDQKLMHKQASINTITFGLSTEEALTAPTWYAQTVIDAQSHERTRVTDYRRLHPEEQSP